MSGMAQTTEATDAFLRELEDAAMAVLVPVRMGKGLDRPALERLKGVLVRAAEMWADSDWLPKTAAALFVDLAPVMESCSYAYPVGDERTAIQGAGQEIDVLVRACFIGPTNVANVRY